MATNRFDKPIESEYISQYTPIPFEQLYAIGKANNERVDKKLWTKNDNSGEINVFQNMNENMTSLFI